MVMATGLYFSPKRGDAQQAQKTELINSWVLGSQKALEVGQYHGMWLDICLLFS